MPNWANLMLTKQGKVLQAKAIAGNTLTITKMKLGQVLFQMEYHQKILLI